MPPSPESLFVFNDLLRGTAYPDTCPFKADRAVRTYELCASLGYFDDRHGPYGDFAAADRGTLELFHAPAYLDLLERAETGRMGIDVVEAGLGTPETPIFTGMNDVARLATGATLAGADLVARGDARLVFSLSGGFHHADPAHAAGFCYVNDAVLACMRLAGGNRRVLYLDIDAHHGDGVERAFYTRSDVMTVSVHESGSTLWPGTGSERDTGAGGGEGYCLNVPLPAHTYDAAYLKAFNALVLPAVERFAPDVIVLEAGMDTLAGDPLTHMGLTNSTVADAAAAVHRLGVPMLVLGGGGYNVERSVRGWALLWGVLTGNDYSDDLMMGMGGVMMESTEWAGGLRDREQPPDPMFKNAVDREIDRVIGAVREQLVHN